MENKSERIKHNNVSGQSSAALIWRFLKGSRLLFALSIISATVSSFADMIGPQIIRAAVDNAIGGREAQYSKPVMEFVNRFGGFEYLGRHLWIMALALLAVALIRTAMQYVFRVSNTAATETLVKTMRDSLFSHIERLPYSWHMKNHTGDIIQRCTSDLDTLRNFVSEQLTNVLRIVILLIFAVVFMLRMDVRLTLIAMIPVPVIIAYSLVFHGKIGKGFLECDENEGILSTMAQENLTGVRVVRAFGRERFERDRFEAQNDYYTGKWAKLAAVMSFYWSSQDILSGLEVMLVVVFGAVYCIRGRMTAGEYIAFISYNSMLVWPIRMLGRMISEMSKAGVSVDRINYIMSSEEEKDYVGSAKPPMDADIVFDHVSFAYEGCPEILHDISFRMKAGSTLGILGGTGSGKSTLMLLLDKMYELPENCGTISIGGLDIRDIDTGWLRSNIGMVLQEPFLFSRSLRDNLAIRSGQADSELIREAADAACLDDTIQSFTKGYDTFVGERGVTLSGGQKQRAAIARMLTKKTPIMIFDDSLSAVDTETDARIRRSLESRFGSASIILISHRITTLSKADMILVLDDGRIVEQGTHEKLCRAGGIYQRINEIQASSRESA
ncbi:MAG: ABC transporter ATP-binding protein/permease [Oscillospiraceae bacterium]|nr:ABC transporter ATP-binding protein/permease [Oscillospiraceae bacterium]